MELETFLVSQPWLAVDNNLPTGTHEAMEQLETMHGMFLVNDHSFCSFAPTHGDQTQFDCAFFLRHTSSSGTKRDANGVMVNPTTASLYMRIQDTLYWVDHAHITRPPVVVSSQPAMPVHTVFELGSIRFRVWMDQALSRDDQLTRLKHVVSSLRQHLRLPSTPPPSLQPSHARLLPRESPYQVFQRHWEHDANCDGKLSAFIELCDTLGIDARVTPAQIPTPDAIAAMWQCKLVHGDLDTLMTAFGLGFSTRCDAHDNCFLLSSTTTTTTTQSQSLTTPTQCTTLLWELWERYLDANDLPLSEEGDHAGSAIEPRVHLLTSAMVCPALRSEWSSHAAHIRSTLESMQSKLVHELFPATLHPPRTDADVQAACARLNAIKQAKKKALRDEFAVVLLPTSRRPIHL